MKTQKDMIKKTLDYIETNLDKDLTLDKISKSIGYSKYHLNRLFMEETGCTIHKYLQSRRLTVAAGKLAETNVPISQIAYESGYNSQQAFTLAFRQVYLCTPGTYRETGVFTPKQGRITMIYNPAVYQKSIKVQRPHSYTRRGRRRTEQLQRSIHHAEGKAA